MSATGLPATDPLAAVTDLWARVRAAAEELGPEDWARPSVLPGWRVQDLFAHLADVQTALDGTAPSPPPPADWQPPEGSSALDRRTEAGVAARRDWSRAEVLDELATAAAGHEARVRDVTDWDAETIGPVGRMPERTLVGMRCYDLWVHLQDLRASLGQPADVDDDRPGALLAHTHVLGLLPWMLAKRIDAPDGSRLVLRLGPPLELATALVREGGRVRFEDAPADGAGEEVVTSAGVLTLLVSGRGEVWAWRDAGRLAWRGALGDAFVERARLFD